MAKQNKITEVISVFFKLGCFSFGGPAAHIAMMEEEIVNRRKWLDRQHFLDLIGATNLIPGPNSTEMTMHCGYERAGILGLFAAGASFILPSVAITGVFAWMYLTYGQLPEVQPFIYGITPAMLAIIAGAILKLGKKALKGWEVGILGGIVLLASLFGINEIAALLGAGLVGMIYFTTKQKINGSIEKSLIPLVVGPSSSVLIAKITTTKVFLTFLKVGAILYGSGYVLFAYLDTELVTKGWLTQQQLLDAVAVGQLTPGPVLSTATFIGYQLNGFYGAIAATVGIFLPSFLFVLLLNPLIPRMRKSKPLGYFLDSVNISAVAIMVATLYNMGLSTIIDWKTALLMVLSGIATFAIKKFNPIWIVIGASGLGYLLSLI